MNEESIEDIYQQTKQQENNLLGTKPSGIILACKVQTPAQYGNHPKDTVRTPPVADLGINGRPGSTPLGCTKLIWQIYIQLLFRMVHQR